MKSLIYSKKIHYNSEIDYEEVIKVIHDVFFKRQVLILFNIYQVEELIKYLKLN